MPMKTKTKVIILSVSISIVLFIIVAHYVKIIKTKDSLEIAQIPDNNVQKVLLAKQDNVPIIMKEFTPLLTTQEDAFTVQDVIQGFHLANPDPISYEDMSFNTAYQLYQQDQGGCHDISIKNLLPDMFQDKLLEYTSPISSITDITISLLPSGYMTPLYQKYVNQNLYLVKTGSLIFQLYHPKYTKYLKKGTTDQHLLNAQIWETDNIISKDAQYIEVIIRSGQAIIIPYSWIHKYTCQEKSSIINLTSTEITGSIIFNLEKLRHNIF